MGARDHKVDTARKSRERKRATSKATAAGKRLIVSDTYRSVHCLTMGWVELSVLA